MSEPLQRFSQFRYFSDRLNEKLQQIFFAPVTVVEAPAGYGKTTALRRFEKMAGIRSGVCWLTAFSQSEQIFWDGLLRALEGIDHDLADALRAAGPPNRANAGKLVSLLQGIRCERETFLILDNFQTAPRQIAYLLTTAWVRQSAPRFHVVFVTQYFRMPERTAGGTAGLHRISDADLRFSPEDIWDFFETMGRRLPGRDEAQLLFDQTEGWPAAVFLYLLGAGKGMTLSAQSHMDQLIAQAYYDHLTAREQETLMVFSLFDTLERKLVRHLLDTDSLGADVLNLIQKTPLIRYDASSDSYFPHAIMQAFLRLRLKGKPALYARLSNRAAQWRAERGDIAGAVRCFLDAGNDEGILALPLVNLRFTTVNGEPFERVIREIIGRCARETLLLYPVSLMRIAYCLFAACDFEGFELAMNLAAEAVHLPGNEELRGEWMLVSALSAFPDILQMGECWKSAALMLKGPSKVLDPAEPFMFGCLSMWYLFYLRPGEGDRVGEQLEEAMKWYNAIAQGRGAGADVLYRAELASIRAQYDEAEVLAHQAAYLARQAGQPTIAYGAALLLGRIAISKSDMLALDRAVRGLENEAVAFPQMQGTALNTVMLDTARAMLRSMMAQNAPGIPKTGGLPSHEPPLSLTTLMTQHIRVTELMLGGEYRQALGLMQAALGMPQRICNTVTRYYMHVGVSLAQLGLGRLSDAAGALQEAMAIAAPDAMVSILVHHRKPLSVLFALPSVSGRYAGLIRKVREVPSSFPATFDLQLERLEEEPLPESLTQREMEIASLAASGLHNREIAKQLFISEYTVKNHLKTIFSKLDIDRRARLSELLR